MFWSKKHRETIQQLLFHPNIYISIQADNFGLWSDTHDSTLPLSSSWSVSSEICCDNALEHLPVSCCAAGEAHIETVHVAVRLTTSWLTVLLHHRNAFYFDAGSCQSWATSRGILKLRKF